MTFAAQLLHPSVSSYLGKKFNIGLIFMKYPRNTHRKKFFFIKIFSEIQYTVFIEIQNFVFNENCLHQRSLHKGLVSFSLLKLPFNFLEKVSKNHVIQKKKSFGLTSS